jgi:hypothetical protein
MNLENLTCLLIGLMLGIALALWLSRWWRGMDDDWRRDLGLSDRHDGGDHYGPGR